MDKGAHFHRCDFQVHSPRDINWHGEAAVTEVERKAYADRFIQTCRAKGLDAVAITDHHDVEFISYIKEASANEVDDEGNPVAESKRIVVFPGIELTLGVPCQAILLLDASFPLSMLPSVLTLLGVQPSDATSSKTALVQRVDTISTLAVLHEKLDAHEHIRGHYIVLPNVSEKGNATLLRSAFAGKYKDMPCVGGYVDGDVSQWGDGNRSITEGKNREYGFKAIGVFQTSDNRHEDFRNLGASTTWVKWAEPTAEALRQACLARATRIRHNEPQLPSVVIQSLEVSNSKFLGPIDLAFNPQFNCLIGGRGTGKSTILEYLRWALCDQPPAMADDELPDYQAKRSGLIENTLGPLDAVVTVTFLLNGVPHLVRRSLRTKEILLKIDEGAFHPCTEDDVRRVLPIQAYSQKQLSAVGVRGEELVRFIKTGVKSELEAIQQRQKDAATRIRAAYGNLRNKRMVERRIKQLEVELDSIKSQLLTLRKQLTGLSEEDKAVLDDHDKYISEGDKIANIDRQLKALQDAVASLVKDINETVVDVNVPDKSPNQHLLTEYSASAKALTDAVSSKATELLRLFDNHSEHVTTRDAIRAKWKELLNAHNVKYEAAKASASSHKSRLDEIAVLDRKIDGTNNTLGEQRQKLKSFGSPEQEFSSARIEWRQVHQDRAFLLAQQCKKLTVLSSNRIKATLDQGAGLGDVRNRLEGVLSGTRVRTKKVDDLCDGLAESEHTMSEWEAILDELGLLAELESTEEADVDLPELPRLQGAGFSKVDLIKLAKKMRVEDWLELALTELQDRPVFEYQQREGEYIAFADASAGQQATALLRVLLSQEGPPLIIDQPEEDLDNQVILEIVKHLWSSKDKRQILFSSHNANIVVNGDADLVICCDYRRAGDQSGGQIKCQGAIDVEIIRKEITTIIEGGKEAFRLRKDKYGF